MKIKINFNIFLESTRIELCDGAIAKKSRKNEKLSQVFFFKNKNSNFVFFITIPIRRVR